jgi:hypothetical protein
LLFTKAGIAKSSTAATQGASTDDGLGKSFVSALFAHISGPQQSRCSSALCSASVVKPPHFCSRRRPIAMAVRIIYLQTSAPMQPRECSIRTKNSPQNLPEQGSTNFCIAGVDFTSLRGPTRASSATKGTVRNARLNSHTVLLPFQDNREDSLVLHLSTSRRQIRGEGVLIFVWGSPTN